MSNPGVGLIRRARNHMGLKLADVAAKAKVSDQSVSRIELQPNPSIATLHKYGRAMGLQLVIAYRAPDGTIID